MNEVLTYDAILNLPRIVKSNAEANDGLVDMLNEAICDKYYYSTLEDYINSLFDRFKELQFFYKFPTDYELSITSSQHIIAGKNLNNSLSSVERMVDNAIDNESWLKKFYDSVVDLSNKLTVFEATYFIDTFFGGRTKTSIADKIGITRQTLRRITKSCLVKAYFEFRYLDEE